MAHQRGWLLVPNGGYLPKGVGEGYKPNTTKDGKFLFVKEVDHPGSKPYNGVGYLRNIPLKAPIRRKGKLSIRSDLYRTNRRV